MSKKDKARNAVKTRDAIPLRGVGAADADADAAKQAEDQSAQVDGQADGGEQAADAGQAGAEQADGQEQGSQGADGAGEKADATDGAASEGADKAAESKDTPARPTDSDLFSMAVSTAADDIKAGKKAFDYCVSGMSAFFHRSAQEIEDILVNMGVVKPDAKPAALPPAAKAATDPNAVAVMASNKVKTIEDVLPKPLVSSDQDVVARIAEVAQHGPEQVAEVILLSPRSFVLRLAGNLTVQINKGTNRVARFIAEHPYCKANDAKIL